VIGGLHLTVGDHCERVEDVAVGPVGETDDRSARTRDAGRHLVERSTVVGHEAGLQQQILGRVAGDRELGEDGEIGALLLGLAHPLVDERHVSGQVTDLRVDLTEGHPKHVHA